jgi:hypothetical protein
MEYESRFQQEQSQTCFRILVRQVCGFTSYDQFFFVCYSLLRNCYVADLHLVETHA